MPVRINKSPLFHSEIIAWLRCAEGRSTLWTGTGASLKYQRLTSWGSRSRNPVKSGSGWMTSSSSTTGQTPSHTPSERRPQALFLLYFLTQRFRNHQWLTFRIACALCTILWPQIVSRLVSISCKRTSMSRNKLLRHAHVLFFDFLSHVMSGAPFLTAEFCCVLTCVLAPSGGWTAEAPSCYDSTDPLGFIEEIDTVRVPGAVLCFIMVSSSCRREEEATVDLPTSYSGCGFFLLFPLIKCFKCFHAFCLVGMMFLYLVKIKFWPMGPLNKVCGHRLWFHEHCDGTPRWQRRSTCSCPVWKWKWFAKLWVEGFLFTVYVLCLV